MDRPSRSVLSSSCDPVGARRSRCDDHCRERPGLAAPRMVIRRGAVGRAHLTDELREPELDVRALVHERIGEKLDRVLRTEVDPRRERAEFARPAGLAAGSLLEGDDPSYEVGHLARSFRPDEPQLPDGLVETPREQAGFDRPQRGAAAGVVVGRKGADRGSRGPYSRRPSPILITDPARTVADCFKFRNSASTWLSRRCATLAVHAATSISSGVRPACFVSPTFSDLISRRVYERVLVGCSRCLGLGARG